MFSRRIFLAAIPATLLAHHTGLQATVYFSAGSVKKQLFPDATRFVDRTVTMTKAQMTSVKKASRTRIKSAKFIAYDAYAGTRKLGTLVIDKVFGKHEFITYAVALDPTGAVLGVEIMDFRESYGDEVRNGRWRAQFSGRRAGEPLKIDRQIKNVSGATLSCVHITNGVRRVLATYALLMA